MCVYICLFVGQVKSPQLSERSQVLLATLLLGRCRCQDLKIKLQSVTRSHHTSSFHKQLKSKKKIVIRWPQNISAKGRFANSSPQVSFGLAVIFKLSQSCFQVVVVNRHREVKISEVPTCMRDPNSQRGHR